MIRYGISRVVEKGPKKGHNWKDECIDKGIPYVTTYNPRNTNIFPVVRACEQLFLHKSDRMRNVQNKQGIINIKRQRKF